MTWPLGPPVSRDSFKSFIISRYTEVLELEDEKDKEWIFESDAGIKIRECQRLEIINEDSLILW